MAKLIKVWDGTTWQEVGTAFPNASFTTDGTQTLTNKTIDLASNTVTGTTAQFNTALSDADFTTLAGTQTLTNKTINLTNNTITGTAAEFNTALSDADFTTLAGTETLTNKTISGASNTLTNIGNGSLTNSSITVNGSAVSLGGSVTITTGGTSKITKSAVSLGTIAADSTWNETIITAVCTRGLTSLFTVTSSAPLANYNISVWSNTGRTGTQTLQASGVRGTYTITSPWYFESDVPENMYVNIQNLTGGASSTFTLTSMRVEKFA